MKAAAIQCDADLQSFMQEVELTWRKDGFAYESAVQHTLRQLLQGGELPLLRPETIGRFYEYALSFHPEGDVLVPTRSRRKSTGLFYTPLPLVEALVESILADQLSQGMTPRVLDPACGCGNFLLGAGRFLRRHGVSNPLPFLHGVDIDPFAVELCRTALQIEFGPSDCHIETGNALELEGEYDAVLGNPPFANAVEGLIDSRTKEIRRRRFPELGGTADLSFYFAAQAERLIGPNGSVGLILPRSFLSARSSAGLRSRLGDFQVLQTPQSHDDFNGAAVFVALVKFRKGSEQTVLRDEVVDTGTFEVRASMTVSEAYRVLPLISDGGAGLRLITTGLIEPEESLWGTAKCRFLKRSYHRPTLPASALPQRSRIAKRPKILVAGLSNRIEAFLDVHGETIGAVSTYTILQQHDDHEKLRGLCQFLLSEKATVSFRETLGPSALGGGSITLTKPMLKQLVSFWNSKTSL